MKTKRHFSDYQLRVICSLLSDTELKLNEIACRMSCSQSAIYAVNKRYGIRKYQGRRISWLVGKRLVSAIE